MGGDLATNKKGVRTMAAAGGVPDRKGGFGPTIKGKGRGMGVVEKGWGGPLY